jgi:pSer/pThr/pTyr-binding forkhead associated (FHA) protein
MMTTGPDESDPGPRASGSPPESAPPESAPPESAPPESETTSTLSLPGLGAGPEDADVAEGEHDLGAPEGLAPGTALLVVQRGPNAGSRYLLETDVTTAGRHHDADVFLDDITVSRRHAEFRREGGSFRVVDVGSLNGTYVNRQRIDDALLAGGDEVQIGKYRLLYFPAAAGGGA